MKNLRRLATGLGVALVLCANLNAEQASTFPLTGKVADAEGRPIAGAVVECHQYGRGIRSMLDGWGQPQRTTTDENGVFELDSSHSTRLLLARSPGLALGWRQVAAKPNSEQILTLTQPLALSGVIVDEKGQPVADAEVYASVVISETMLEGGARLYRDYLMGTPARSCFNTRTSADGHFRIEGLPAGASVSLAIEAPGLILPEPARDHLGPDALQCRAGEEDLRLVAEPAGIIEGRIVTDVEDESPSVARLVLRSDGQGFFGLAARKPATSNPDGTFRISDLAEGSYRIFAVFGTNAVPDWVANPVSASVTSGETTRGIELTATHGGVLEVAILAEDGGKPLSEANVQAYGRGFQTGGVSDNHGIALLRLPPGEYQLSAQWENWMAVSTGASVEAGTTNRLEVGMAPPPTVSGVVRRPDGQPAAGLPVQIVGHFSGDDSQVKTDEDGRFEMEWHPQRYGQMDMTFCLLIRDPERNLAVATDVDEDTEPLELELEPGLTLIGGAECGGKPLTNTTAALLFRSGNMGMLLSGLAVGTNTPGYFEIPALPPDREYGLYISAPGYGRQHVDAHEFEEENGRIEIDPVELKPANMKLAGQVLDADDEPVAGAYVNLSGEGQPNGNTRTDKNGWFEFDQVCEGNVRVYANTSGGSYGNIMAEAGDTNVVIQLGETFAMSSESVLRELTGVVTDPDGKPVEDARVSVFPDGASRWVKTDAKGAFKLRWSLQPWQLQSGGDPCLVVRDPVRDLAAAEYILEEDTNLNVTLTPALTLTGQVENAEGEPLARAQVGLWLMACRTYSQLNEQLATTDESGRFEIKTVPLGPQYTIYAMAQDHGRSRRELDEEMEAGLNGLDPFVLKRADQVIAGVVVNEDDKPIPGVSVHLSGDDQPEGSDTTDRKGRFNFKVCEGTASLYASSQDGYSDVTAEAGDTNVVIQLIRDWSFGERAVQRRSLKGKPLPDLSSMGLDAEALPEGKSALLCLVDVEQRPSRRMARLLTEREDTLQQKGVSLVIVQAAVITPESLRGWKTDNAIECAVGCVEQESPKVQWATDVEALPWLILTDPSGTVTDEGFLLDDLDTKLDELSE